MNVIHQKIRLLLILQLLHNRDFFLHFHGIFSNKKIILKNLITIAIQLNFTEQQLTNLMT